MPYTLFLQSRNPRLAWLVVYLRLQTARINVKSNFALSVLAGRCVYHLGRDLSLSLRRSNTQYWHSR